MLRRLNMKSHLILFELELAVVVVIYTHLGTYPCSSCQQGRLIALRKRSRAKGKTSAAEAAHRLVSGAASRRCWQSLVW